LISSKWKFSDSVRGGLDPDQLYLATRAVDPLICWNSGGRHYRDAETS
jgi:hypothetical protein